MRLTPVALVVALPTPGASAQILTLTGTPLPLHRAAIETAGASDINIVRDISDMPVVMP